VAAEGEPGEGVDVDGDDRVVERDAGDVEDHDDDDGVRVAQLVVADEDVELAVVEGVAALDLNGGGHVGAGDPDDGVRAHVPEGQEDVER